MKQLLPSLWLRPFTIVLLGFCCNQHFSIFQWRGYFFWHFFLGGHFFLGFWLIGFWLLAFGFWLPVLAFGFWLLRFLASGLYFILEPKSQICVLFAAVWSQFACPFGFWLLASGSFGFWLLACICCILEPKSLICVLFAVD